MTREQIHIRDPGLETRAREALHNLSETGIILKISGSPIDAQRYIHIAQDRSVHGEPFALIMPSRGAELELVYVPSSPLSVLSLRANKSWFEVETSPYRFIISPDDRWDATHKRDGWVELPYPLK